MTICLIAVGRKAGLDDSVLYLRDADGGLLELKGGTNIVVSDGQDSTHIAITNNSTSRTVYAIVIGLT